MHYGKPYGRNQGQGQGHSREVDRQSPTGQIFFYCCFTLLLLSQGCQNICHSDTDSSNTSSTVG